MPRPRPSTGEIVRPIRPVNNNGLDDASWERVRQRVADEAARAAVAPPETRRRPGWLLPLTVAVVTLLAAAVLIAMVSLR